MRIAKTNKKEEKYKMLLVATWNCWISYKNGYAACCLT